MRSLALVCFSALSSAAAAPVFHVQLDGSISSSFTGRVFVFVSTVNSTEPRFLVGDDVDTQQFFGVDVEGLSASSSPVVVDGAVLGYPLASTADIPVGDYTVQAVLQPYHQYANRSDNLTLWLPRVEVNRFEGGDLFGSPGTYYSAPSMKRLSDDGGSSPITLTIDQVVKAAAAPAPPPDTDWVKHVKVTSRLLSDWWGEPVALEACVLLPWGFDDPAHADIKYPTFLYHGHYHDDWATPVGFSETPPPPGLTGYDKVQAEYAYELFQNWTSPHGVFKGSRGLIVTVKHPTPYYDDSYAVNSANMGPYGDAIMRELLPAVEKRFRGISEGWARVTYGGSTGGWESIAVQTFYPDDFNGCWTFCPDPVSFDAYTTVNIYKDTNAYYDEGPWKRVPRPAIRDAASNGIWHGSADASYGSPLGHVVATQEQVNIKELVKGTKGRSADQWDIWQLVFGPKAADGYVQPIWDKRTGAIDPEVAAYWREHFDLRYILERDWATIGPKLRGKIHVFVGMSDTYYLNDAVYSLEAFLQNTTPPSDAYFHYGEHDGRGYEHCYSGNDGMPNSLGRLTINARVLPQMSVHMAATAPQGADLRWRDY